MKPEFKKLSIVIPVYNEAQTIDIHDFGQVEDVTWNLPW